MIELNDMAEAITFSNEPLIKQIYDKSGKKLLAIGLRHGVTLPEDVARAKAKLMVVQGEIDVNTATHSFRLERFDSFDIPKDVKHTIVGVFDAVFLLLLGRPQEA